MRHTSGEEGEEEGNESCLFLLINRILQNRDLLDVTGIAVAKSDSRPLLCRPAKQANGTLLIS